MPILAFDMDTQIEGLWCWAAVANGVSHFYDQSSKFSQCLIAEKVLTITQELTVRTCCPHDNACNLTADLKKALGVTGNFVQKKGKISWDKLENELSNGRVVAARIKFPSGAGHFVVLYGTTETSGVKYVSIDDPLDGAGHLIQTLGQLRSNYRQDNGKWTNTYLTQ